MDVSPIQMLVVSLLITGTILCLNLNHSSAQDFSLNETTIGSRDQNHTELSKIATSTTIISNNSAFIGGFNTTYRITGSPIDIDKSKNVVVSSIVKDFANSSTIGYVELLDPSSNSDKQEIANPFASNEQIDQKIEELLNKSIYEATNSEIDLIEIRCLFGNSLDDFSCSLFPLAK
jgi:hypothetical protein